ncbi:MAG: flagellar hook-basal body complex protein FliE [Alteromonas sp.]|jgi:flagellar hook-basal body complex protein FliE|uniref:flagellar hook-basal body complex protein FliE n=1 Tax=Alteromonas sp. TaxID=232 RepID=UPI0032D93742
MDVKANSLYQEMQSMIGQTRLPVNELQPSNGLQPTNEINTSASDFSSMLKNAVDGVNSMQLESKNLTQRFEMGDPNLSLAEVMLAKEKSGIAFEATVQVRNKVLEAYKTIMNMPV